MNSSRPVAFKGLPTSSSESSQQPNLKDTRREHLLKGIQKRIQHGVQTKYLWDFYYDKHSSTSDYGERLTLYNETPIDNLPTFWRYYNNLPLTLLNMRDSVHFFKHTVHPMWEDARNQDGGAWCFKLPDEKALAPEAKDSKESHALRFFEDLLMLAVGEAFSDVIQPKDDLCGISYTRRYSSSLIMIWTRKAKEQKTIQGIKDIVDAESSAKIRTLLQNEKYCYYKTHREHAEALRSARWTHTMHGKCKAKSPPQTRILRIKTHSDILDGHGRTMLDRPGITMTFAALQVT